MNISDNILRHHLRHARFLAGTACGGKTTLARRLAEKHGLPLYLEGTYQAEHNQLASPESQPALSRTFPNWTEYFTRPYQEYAQWLADTLPEAAEMVLLDIISRFPEQEVIVDFCLPLEFAERLIAPNRIVFLTAAPELVVSDYFSRPDHREILDCILSLPDPDQARANVEKTLAYGTERLLQKLSGTDWYCIPRDRTSTVEATLRLIEEHFGLA